MLKICSPLQGQVLVLCFGRALGCKWVTELGILEPVNSIVPFTERLQGEPTVFSAANSLHQHKEVLMKITE